MVNGKTVIESAPPRPAELTAMVVRTMFTYGSRLVIIRQAVSAAMTMGAGRKLQVCSTRAHHVRDICRQGVAIDVKDNSAQINSFQSAADRLLLDRQAVAIGPGSPGKNKREPGRAVCNLMHGLGIGICGIWVVEALHDRPGR